VPTSQVPFFEGESLKERSVSRKSYPKVAHNPPSEARSANVRKHAVRVRNGFTDFGCWRGSHGRGRRNSGRCPFYH
jgi:hypothetical protein